MTAMASMNYGGGGEDFGGGRVGGEGWGSSLPRLVQETELQKILADEKMRSEQHKTNYITLKAEHTRLQEEYKTIQNDLKTTIEESRLVREKYERLLSATRGNLAEKQAENETLKGQVLDPRKLERVKLELEGEVGRPMRERYDRLEAELDRLRAEHNKLKYEHSFVKSEHEHQHMVSKAAVEELKLRHEAEVTNLRREREALISRHEADGASDSQRLRMVQKENVTLNQKVKSLLGELEELRARREHAGQQADSVARVQLKQLSDSLATTKALEAERASLRQQVDDLQRELSITSSSQSNQSSRIHALERDNQSLRSRAEEAEHKAKLDVSNVRVELMRERGELERERDRLANQLTDVQSELDSAQSTVLELEKSLVEREREGVAKVQAASEEAWQKLHLLEADKLALESRIAELEKQRLDSEEEVRRRVDEAEQERRRALAARESADKDVTNMRSKLENQQLLLDRLENVQTENSDIRGRLQRLQAQYEEFVDSQGDIVGENERLEREIEIARGEGREAREQGLRAREEAESIVARERSHWMEDRVNLQSRVEELDNQLSIMAKKLSANDALNKQKKSRMKVLILKLKDKVTQLQTKCDQLQIEKEAIRRSQLSGSPVNSTARGGSADEATRRRLKELLQRNREFRTILQNTEIKQIDIGGLQFGCLAPPSHSTDGTGWNEFLPAFNAYFEKNQKELSLIRDRIDHLDLAQRQQLDELKPNSALFTSAAPSTLRLVEEGGSKPSREGLGGSPPSSVDSRGEGGSGRGSGENTPPQRKSRYDSDEGENYLNEGSRERGKYLLD